MADASSCVILVPAAFGIEPQCERALKELERRGYSVWRVEGFAALDQGRSQMATDALAQGFEELFWIDADIQFEPDAVERLRGHGKPIVSAIYPKKGQRALASHLLPGTKQVIFGQGGGLIEILYAATGFLCTQRRVYEDMQERLRLPVCNLEFGKPLVPYFMSLVSRLEAVGLRLEDGGDRAEEEGADGAKGRLRFLADDFAFCHRARQAGHTIYADTTIRLGHIGRYAFTWEDAGISPPRYATFTFHVNE